jgi:hypothetical protein
VSSHRYLLFSDNVSIETMYSQRWDDYCTWSSQRNENWQGKLKNSEKACPTAAVTTADTWPDLGLNQGCHSVKLATNHKSHSMASPVYENRRRKFHVVHTIFTGNKRR